MGQQYGFKRRQLSGIKGSFKEIVAHCEKNHYIKLPQQNPGLLISDPLLLPLTLNQLLSNLGAKWQEGEDYPTL